MDRHFLQHLNLKYPLIVAPMAGGPSSLELVTASCESGVLGSIGAAYSAPSDIEGLVTALRLRTSRSFAINLFIPHPEPKISDSQRARALHVTEKYRRALTLPEPVLTPPYEQDFSAQFETVLKLRPQVLSFVFGLLDPIHIKAAHKAGIFLIGTATSLTEALQLEASGVDAITLQGFEAGGHRGLFDPDAIDPEIPSFELLSQCRPRIKGPLIVAGGLMTAVDIRRALEQGADAVQMGTAFLACQESGASLPYRRALLANDARITKTTRVFSGRLARGMINRFMHEMEEHPDSILAFPAQNQLTRDLRAASVKKDSSEYLSLWAGSAEGRLWTGSAAELIATLFP